MRSRSGLPILMLNFRRPTREKSNLRGSKNIAFEAACKQSERSADRRDASCGRSRAAHPRGFDHVLLQGLAHDRADIVFLGQENSNDSMPASMNFCNLLRRHLLIAFGNDFAVSRVYQIRQSEAPSNRSATSTLISVMPAWAIAIISRLSYLLSALDDHLALPVCDVG